MSAVAPRLAVDDAGHMLLGSRYRKPVAGINAPKLRFLNAYFAVDGARLYALSEDSLVLCEGADVSAIAVEGHAVSDGTLRFVFDGNRVRQEPC